MQENRDNLKEEDVEERLVELAVEALAQIEEKQYENIMRQSGITQFLEIGMSFYKKQVQIISKMSS